MKRPGLLAALGYLVVALVLLAPSIRPGRTLVPADTLTEFTPYRQQAGGYRAHNKILTDPATQFFPWYRFLDEQLRDGHFPGWNPEILGGVRVTPNGYVNPYYPPFWLGRFLSTYDAYNLFVLLHLVLGALGVYAFSRVLGVRPLPAWLVGLLAPAAGMWLHWSLHLVHLVGMVALPWALAAAHRLIERPTPRRAAALATVVALWWLGGSPQYAYFGGLALAGYALARLAFALVDGDRARAGRAALGLAGAAVVGALVAAPVLLPTLRGEHIVRAREPSAAMTATHLPVRHAIRVLVPDATGNPADGRVYSTNVEDEMDSPYVGLVAVLLAGTALAAAPRRGTRRRDAVVLATGAGVALALAFLGPPHALLHALLPGYDRFRGSARWVAVLPAFALPLAAIGLDAVLAGDRRARRAVLVAAGVAVALVAAWLAREATVSRAPHAYLTRRALLAVLLTGAVAAAVALRRPRLTTAVIAAVVAVEVAVAVPHWYPRVQEARAYRVEPALMVAARRGGRLVRVEPGRVFPRVVPPDVPMAYGAADVSGLTPLFPADYDRYLRLISDYGPTARELNVAPSLPSPDLVRSPLLDALDVRTVLLPDGSASPRPSPGPAVLVPRATPATGTAMWRAVAAPGWDPTATAAVVGLRRAVDGGRGRVTGGATSTDHEEWAVDAPAGGFLRVSGRWDDGWSARVDGRSTEVLRADGIFRGVVVPPGRHAVVFSFRDADEARGRLVAMVGLAALVVLAVRRAGARDKGVTSATLDAT